MSGSVGTTRVQLMCTKFEKLLKEEHQSRQTIPKVAPRGPHKPLLQRSATSFTLRRVDSTEKLSDPSATKRIKRSPAFREKLQARNRVQSVPGAATTSPEVRVEHTDTILRVLKHPLPKGPPPKKPPRTFEATPPRDSPLPRPRHLPPTQEHIYMEPFEHLRSPSDGTESPSAGSTASTSSSSREFLRESPSSPPKPELHYLCTDVTRLREEDRSFEKIYDQVGEIVTVAFDKSVTDANITLLPTSDPGEKILTARKEPSTNLSRSCTEKRREYVRRTSTLYGTLHRRESVDCGIGGGKSGQKDVDLFRMCLLVEFNSITNSAHIKSQFPAERQLPRNVEQLVFPCGLRQNERDVPVREGQDYSLILTNDNGERLYGYCRRILPENSEIFLPMAYCLLTDTKAPGFYFKLLREIESRHGQTKSQFTRMLQDLLELKLPPPGQVLSLRLSASGSASISRGDFSCISTASYHNTDVVFLRRPTDVRLESSDLWLLHRTLGSELLLHVFGTLLLERKVILFSTSIHLVSSCILALAEILYPLQWHYTLITVLPHRLLEICQAPFPVLVGAVCPEIHEMVIDDGIVVNLDAKRMTQCCGDEMTLIPAKLRNSLLVSLEMYNALNEDKFLLSVLIAEAFLRFFIEIFDNFPKDIPFQKEKLINSHPNPSVQIFLEWFVETAMFHHFVKMRHSQLDKFYRIFEARLVEKGQGDRRKILMQNLSGTAPLTRKTKTIRERFREFFE